MPNDGLTALFLVGEKASDEAHCACLSSFNLRESNVQDSVWPIAVRLYGFPVNHHLSGFGADIELQFVGPLSGHSLVMALYRQHAEVDAPALQLHLEGGAAHVSLLIFITFTVVLHEGV